ncbi:MAG: MotA/TolQ/ExbB proton channel family protein [bacterium]
MMWILEYSLEGWQSLAGQGGIIVYLLGLASVVGLAIIIEKVIRLRKSNVFSESDAVDLLLAIKKNNSEQLAGAKRESPGPMVDIVNSAQLVEELPKDDMLSEMAAVASMHIRKMSKRIRLLGILASISPLLGLLGTVVGMIRAMGEVSLGAQANPLVVGQGISQALVTTAVGLSVGIPMLVVHSLLKDRVNRYAAELEEFSHEVMKAFHYPESLVTDEKSEEITRENTEGQEQEKKISVDTLLDSEETESGEEPG